MGVREDDVEFFRKLRAQNVDKIILANGGISLYRKEVALDYDIKLLIDKDYQVIEFDGRFISTKAELHFDLYQQLQFPSWYGHNFDALNDCLRDWEVAANGTAFIFRNLSTLEPEHINALLHILSMHSRHRLPYGKKLITLIQGELLELATTKPIGAINLYVWSGLESPGGYGNLLSESERP